MRSKVSLPWNAAAWRQSTYEPRVRKVHGPVGEPLPEDNDGGLVCLGCGHHVCSCERQPPIFNVEASAYSSWKDSKPEPVCTCPGECNFPTLIDLEDGRAPNHPDFANLPAFVLQPPNPGPAGPMAEHEMFAHIAAQYGRPTEMNRSGVELMAALKSGGIVVHCKYCGCVHRVAEHPGLRCPAS